MSYSIVFPGQGSQSVGMLSELAENFQIVKEVFQEASDALSIDLWNMCQTDNESLNQTINTQPAMLTAGYATLSVLKEECDLKPQSYAGHSLGEYTALVAAESIKFYDAIKLVRKRAELMQDAVPSGTGGMAAILGLSDEEVINVCLGYEGEGIIEPVNFNSPGQVVVAGSKEAVDEICELMKEAGAKRAVPLQVSVPSHCSLMNSASHKFSAFVNETNIQLPNNSVIHNVGAVSADSIDQIKEYLINQIKKPVLWTQTISNMSNLGVEKIIECGPGKVLAGLTRRINKNLSANAIIDKGSLEETIKEIS
jgi:[acyl-carrier-protein] S-malonyltransferase